MLYCDICFKNSSRYMYSCNHMYCTNCNKKTKETCVICNEKKELISFDNNPDDHTLLYDYTSYSPEVRNRINEYYNRINTIIDRQNILNNISNTNSLNTILYPINDIGTNNLNFSLTSTPIRTTPIIFIDPNRLTVFR